MNFDSHQTTGREEVPEAILQQVGGNLDYAIPENATDDNVIVAPTATADEGDPVVQTAEAFLTRCFEEKEPLVEGLVHKRDLVALGARRRHGKTTFVLNLAIAGAVASDSFIGYPIPNPFRSMLFMLEDDSGELQEKLRLLSGDKDLAARVALATRDDFREQDVPIHIRDQKFQRFVKWQVKAHAPDLTVFDNLSYIVGGEYSDPKLAHHLMDFMYRLAHDHNSAIILPAHPRKMDKDNRIRLEDDPEMFVEQIMGTSHFINSTGSTWALERRDQEGHSLFMGGRQRGSGSSGQCYLTVDDENRLHLVDDHQLQMRAALNTDARLGAWNHLPERFTYREGEAAVKPIMKSSSTYYGFIKQCERQGLLVKEADHWRKTNHQRPV